MGTAGAPLLIRGACGFDLRVVLAPRPLGQLHEAFCGEDVSQLLADE